MKRTRRFTRHMALLLALVLCIGINFLGMTKIKTANMLPALLVPVLWSFLQPLFSGAA